MKKLTIMTLAMASCVAATAMAQGRQKAAAADSVEYSVSVPADAEFFLGYKKTHFVDFTEQTPCAEKTENGVRTITYKLPANTYNFRTWRKGGLTQAGDFKLSKTPADNPVMNFTDADYAAMDPHTVNHTPQANGGYETGDIFINGNERGHVALKEGDTFKAHAMRTWQLTNSTVGNYFMEPDFHYTVTDADGKPLDGVVEITAKPGSAWADIKAVGKGTAIVTVTYDAIKVTSYSKATPGKYVGGNEWGAIWPENTAVMVVTVGEGESQAKANMTVNEDYNKETLKVAGKNVDAEHDVFYYLDDQAGYSYTFKPEGVAKVELAYPHIGTQSATYAGFGSEGVTANADGSYTLLLKEGRQIVRLTDAEGNSQYQVVRARACHREITNASRPGSKVFQPGDEVAVQYDGVYHPANKLAGIYNMSAYVTYNGVPNGTELILGKAQYNFGSTAKAQCVTVKIPADYDVAANPTLKMDKGVLQVNGYGDPIGNHRLIDPEKGRNANLNAQAHKTYFGGLPDVEIVLTPYRQINVKLTFNADKPAVKVLKDGNEVAVSADGTYPCTYGTYQIQASKAGYRYLQDSFTLTEDAEDAMSFAFELQQAKDGAWDGESKSEPAQADGVYQIGTGAQMAWLADYVNTVSGNVKAVLTADIDLADYQWTSIGTSSRPFAGKFDGAGHKVEGLYMENAKANDMGLFGYITGSTEAKAEVSGLTVYGKVSGKTYCGGLAGRIKNAVIDRCGNYVAVTGVSYSGGVAGYVVDGVNLTNVYNAGALSCPTNGGGISSRIEGSSVENVYNVGEITGTSNTAALCAMFNNSTASNVYANRDYLKTGNYTLVNDEQVRSGELAYKLGEAFGQKIGEDAHPVLGGMKVLYDEAENRYYNETDGVDAIESAGAGKGEPVGYYNLQGVRLQQPCEGLNVVVYSDGRTEKVYIKR